MLEPLDEKVETQWLEMLDEYDQEIYPVLFDKHGISREMGLLIWTINRLRNDVDEVRVAIEERTW